MTMATSTSSVADWRPAREFPETYPGDVPNGSFCMVDDQVVPMRTGSGAALADIELLLGADWISLADQLDRWSLPSLEPRVPLVAYGGNRNPGTVALKCRHYGYKSSANRAVFPLIRADLPGVDIVAGGLSDQGYLYADVYLPDPPVPDLSIEVWIMLLDDDALRMLHDSEGVNIGAYGVAQVDNVRASDRDDLGAFVYSGGLPVFSSPVHDSPIAFSSVRSTGRALPQMTATEMLTHALETLGVEAEVRELTGITDDDLGAEFMKYMNGQFWYRRHTGRERLRGCERAERRIWEALLASTEPGTAVERFRDRGMVMNTADSYDVPGQYRLGSWWAT